MSSSGMMSPQTPFCPCLLENLSPSYGLLISLNTVLMTVLDSSFWANIILSTYSGLLFLKTSGSSFHSIYWALMSYIMPFLWYFAGITGIFLFM